MSLQKNETEHVVDVGVGKANVQKILSTIEGLKKWYTLKTDLDWTTSGDYILHIYTSTEKEAGAIEEYLVHLGWTVL